jgi:hypothetical protein
LFLLVATPPAGAAAQAAHVDSSGVHRSWASPHLPDRHWSMDALWRAESLGLLEGFLPAQRTVPRYAAGAALLRAREAAARDAPWLAPLVDGWYSRFLEEFPDFAARLGAGSDASPLGGSRVSAGYERWNGRVAPGINHFPPDRTGPLPLAELDHPIASATLSTAGRHLALEVAPRLRGGEVDLRVADAALAARGWMLSVGRRPIGYGADGGEGVVLSGGVPVDRIQVETVSPIRFGTWLRPLGAASVHAFFGRLPEERHPGRPFFWGGRGALKPHPRVNISVQRAAMFGGDGSEIPVTAHNLLRMLVGSIRGGPFEDQIVSVMGRYHLPSEAILPLTVYLEWGAEDGAGALRDVPGRLWGIAAPALPMLPQASLGLEYATFGAACCGNPPWYRHYGFPGNWAGDDRPLGHRLGGQGSELRVRSRADLAGARLRLDAEVFRREREGDNLFAPERGGQSNGLAVGTAWRVHPGADLVASVAEERGDGWAERRLELGGTFFVGRNR